ncbi:MAG: hypothetical protein ACLQVI_14285 [Polyangiaceae bacterium]|jgi:hypothetical protein
MSASKTGTWDRWRSALGHGAQWRYLLLFLVAMALPAAFAFGPIALFLQTLFDHSPRFAELTSKLDSPALTEVVRQMSEPAGSGIMPGFHHAFLAAVLLSPALAGAAAVLARSDEPSDIRALLGGAGEFFPRMLRMVIAASIPFGVAAGLGALAFHFAEKVEEGAVLESTASNATNFAMAITALLVWLAHVTVEAGRAHLAAEPERTSALVAWWSGVRLAVRRPAQVFGLCLMTTVVAVGLALVLNAVRYRITQSGGGSIALAFVLGQLGVVAIAWGRSSRLSGLVAVIREESAGKKV